MQIEGGRRAAAVYSLIASAKLNNIDPQVWLADVLPPAGSPRHAHTRTLALESACSERRSRRPSASSHSPKTA
jgi:hypothetical protein